MDAEELRRSLGPGFSLDDHGAFGAVTDADGLHVALVAYSPAQVEVDLSVVLVVTEEELQDAAEAADRLLRAEQIAPWIARGFVPAELGAVYEGESAADPEAGVLSYDLPVTSLARDAAQVRELLDFALGQPRDFLLWGPDGPLTVVT